MLTAAEQTAKFDVSRAAVYVFSALIAFILVGYRLDYAYPPGLRPFIYRGMTVVWLAGLIGLLVLAVKGLARPGRSEVGQAGAWCCLAQVTLSLFFNLPTSWFLAAGVSLYAAAFWLARRFGPVAVMHATLLIIFALFLGKLTLSPADHGGADMLPFIEHAIDVFQSGGDPYSASYSFIDDNPFFYAPMQWLVFLPAHVAGLDVRWTSFACALLMVGLVEWRAWRGDPGLRAGLYPLLVCPFTPPMMQEGQVWPYWLCLLCFATLATARRWILAAVSIGLAIAMRQTALVPACLVFVGLIGMIRPAKLTHAMAAGVVVLLVCFVPFVARSEAALNMMFVDGPRRALEQAHLQGNPGSQVALSNWFDWLGVGSMDGWVEIGLAASMLPLAFAAARRGSASMLLTAGLGYAIVLTANPYLHRYYYVGGLILAAVGMTTGRDLPLRQRTRQTRVAETA